MDRAAEKKAMRPRGSGSVYLRGKCWWIKYYDRNGEARRESSGSTFKSDAERLLRKRVGEVASGKRFFGADLEKTTFEDLAKAIEADYRANGRRSLHRLQGALGRLREYFAGWKARDIDFSALQGYRAQRKASAATIRWELGALKRAFRLAEQDGRAETPIFPTVTVNNARQGFFELEQWQAIRALLRSEFQDIGDFAYLTGWRIMEILRLRWAQVDFKAGVLRLEPGTTKTGAGRTFPFAEYPPLLALLEGRRSKRDELQKMTAKIIPWVFFFHDLERFHRPGDPIFKGANSDRPSEAFRIEWRRTTEAAGYPGLIPHDFRRTAARNMERAGLPRSVAKALGGWKSDSMYNRYAIANEADLRDGVRRLGSCTNQAKHEDEKREVQKV